MVMNSHYGKRADMPFDLGHKGGPIMYKLGPDAGNVEIERRRETLLKHCGTPSVSLFQSQ